MATTLHLPYKRYVRQVSNGCARSKYAYQAMQKENELALQTAQWREATCANNEVGLTVNAVSATDGIFDPETNTWTVQPSYKQYMRDRYDAFKQGGDGVPELATMCGYAGMAAYRFALPSSASSVSLSSVKLLVARDRYCLAGVRIAVVLSDESAPGSWCTWDVVRGNGTGAIVSPSSAGEGSAKSWGFLNQSAVPCLVAGRAEEGALELKASAFPALAQTGKAYLWVFISIEDYSDWWQLYDNQTPRYYSIEGSAMLVGANCEFVFSDSVTDDDPKWATSNDSSGAGAFDPSTFLPDETSGAVQDRSQADAIALRDQVYAVFGERYVSLCSADAVATVPGTGNASEDVGRLLRLADLPRATYLTGAAGSGFSTRPISPVDMGKFALNKFEVNIFQVGSSSKYAFAHVGGKAHRRTFGARLDLGTTSWAIANQSVAEANCSMLKMLSADIVVPAGCAAYHGLYIGGDKNLIPGIADFDFGGVNFWLVESPSLAGPWRHVAIGALLSNPTIYSHGAETVTASAEGDGTYTTGITVQATAKKIGNVNFSAFALSGSNDYAVRLLSDTPMVPGSTIIVSPCLAPAPTGAGNYGEMAGHPCHVEYEIDDTIFYEGEVAI